ncbi:hypothetical protein BU15DRAFT_40109 [Melanogaster broomeanus]|nr:hypothetical protein BU15DRAFT_40109 [Melanogaster broomeanus]
MSSFNYRIYFTGKDDPRDGCIVMGEDQEPVFFEFETAFVPETSTTRTTICSDQHPVAAFDWDMNGAGLGLATVGDRVFPMEHLVIPGPGAKHPFSCSARRFQAANGRFYDWRRSANSGSYELYAAPNTPPIAVYSQFPQETPIGPSHGILEYNFVDALFLLEALLALNLNRWLDWND